MRRLAASGAVGKARAVKTAGEGMRAEFATAVAAAPSAAG